MFKDPVTVIIAMLLAGVSIIGVLVAAIVEIVAK